MKIKLTKSQWEEAGEKIGWVVSRTGTRSLEIAHVPSKKPKPIKPRTVRNSIMELEP